MGQYLRINGDYNIKTKDGGTIVLDTGPSGDTIVTGNLSVQGDLTAISSSNLEIEDRIIQLNKGEAGPGVTLTYSGIEIDRGNYVDSTQVPKAAFIWNETNPPAFVSEDTLEEPASNSGYWMVATGDEDTGYGFRDSNLKLRRILTDASTDNGDLILIGTGTGTVKITGHNDYTQEILDRAALADPEVNDILTNKGYVDYSILNNPTFQIRSPGVGPAADTRIIIADKEVLPNIVSNAGSLSYFTDQTGYTTAGESAVSVIVDGTLNSQFYPNRAMIQGLEFVDTEITNNDTNTNIYVRTNGTGKLQTNYAIQLDNNPVSPAIVSGSHVVYSKPQNTGGSGIFFVNTENNRDELVSKNRALLFSMLF